MASEPTALLDEPPGVTAPPRTIPRLWRNAVAARRPGPAYVVQEDGHWRELSWTQAGNAVEELANGLLSLGVERGDVFGILGSTRVEWALVDFALAHVGAVSAPIYPTSAARDCAYVLTHSGAVGVVVEDDAQRAKIAGCPLRHVLSFADLRELRARGREHALRYPNALAEVSAAVGEDDLFTYIYTSGTTGEPKACMLRHRNFYEMAAVIDSVREFYLETDLLLLHLPLAHSFGRLMHLSGPFAGFTIAFCPDPAGIPDALVEVRPTLLPSVPRVYEKLYTAVRAAFAEMPGPKRRLVQWALEVGRRVSAARQAAEPVPFTLAWQHRLAERLVYGKVKARLGGRLRIGVSGGAPLGQEIAEFFHALDVLVLEGYGLSECAAAATVNRPHRFRLGTVGPALPGVDLRVAEDGELLMRSGTVFAGYLNDPEATAEVLDADGWFRTGDIGQIDADGFVTITDRKKDLIVTAGGKNVAPQPLENALKSSSLIAQALVVGDRRPYLAALLTLGPDAPREGAEGLVGQVVAEVNSGRSSFEQIKRFAIVPREFSEERGEVTPTLKLRRGVCLDHFADEIDRLYA